MVYETTVAEEDIIKVSDKDGNVMELLETGGQYLSARGVIAGKFPNPKTNFPRLKAMDIKSDDIFLCAYPKAGTHWTWEIISMILQQKAEYHPKAKETHMLEFHTPEVLEPLTSPRVFNTHLLPNNVPEQFFQKRCKMVFVQRNPKDMAVSFYHHCSNLSIKFPGSFLQFMDFFMGKHGPMYHCAWPSYVSAWENYIKDHTDHPVHCIMYEELHQDAIGEIQRLAAFLDKPCDDELAEQIAEKCSFQNLKNATSNIKEEGMKRSANLYRKGKVGDWKNHFTVALNEEFDQYLQRHKTAVEYKFEIYKICIESQVDLSTNYICSNPSFGGGTTMVYETTVAEEDIIKVSDKDGNVMELLETGGQYLSAQGVIAGRFPNPKTNFPRLKAMNVRSDDIFLCAYPKAGTHWTWEIISMILQQKAEYHPKAKETHMLEFHTPEVLEPLTSPRVFNSHLLPNNVPEQFSQKLCKLVFVQRNPKDMAVSFYHHCSNIAIKFPGSFVQFMDFFMGKHGPMYQCAWPFYVSAWENYIKEHPDHPVHCIMYEDLHEDAIGEIQRLAAFLDKPCDDELAKQIAEKCSFQNLKNAASNIKEEGMKRSSNLYRKGKVGDWKNHFTVALNEEFDQYIQRHKSAAEYKFEI
ncbi:uncharacterized protein LOC125647317 [Ostrea edulis]|uniref:uncharacterized protein LOC125647317 n=1 Tax=Ostrea edulis TaxID=37623 RepID=UPI0024AFC04E|nr:uncharacterized protein LOC125647317 [Ostrea edulis]